MLLGELRSASRSTTASRHCRQKAMADGARSGGAGFGAAVGGPDALDDERQPVRAREPAPFPRGGADVGEHHEPHRLMRRRALRPDGPVPDRGGRGPRPPPVRGPAGTRSMGVAVRRWSRCSAGGSRTAGRASRLSIGQATALWDLAPHFSAKVSMAVSAGPASRPARCRAGRTSRPVPWISALGPLARTGGARGPRPRSHRRRRRAGGATAAGHRGPSSAAPISTG